MRKSHLLLPLLIVVLGLAACGGGDEGSGDGVAEVTAAIEEFETNSNPAACKTLATQGFLEQAEFNLGHEAVQRCEEDAERTVDDPSSMEITEVEVDGSSATADVAFEGGTLDGQTLAIALVEEGGRWKLDSTTGFVKLDKDKLATASEASLESQGVEGQAQLISCYGDALRSLPDEEVEELMLSGSQPQILAILRDCTKGAA